MGDPILTLTWYKENLICVKCQPQNCNTNIHKCRILVCIIHPWTQIMCQSWSVRVTMELVRRILSRNMMNHTYSSQFQLKHLVIWYAMVGYSYRLGGLGVKVKRKCRKLNHSWYKVFIHHILHVDYDWCACLMHFQVYALSIEHVLTSSHFLVPPLTSSTFCVISIH